MKKFDLAKIERFQKLLHSFALIERVAHVTNRPARENDVEHSYFLSMLAWYFVDAFELPLNKDRVRSYALVHDLVEVYAGDTYIFDADAQKTKKEREAKAQERLKTEFPEFAELHETIEKYEAQSDEESRFVKALDKVEPVIENYLQKGRTWKEMDVVFEDLRALKREKVAHQKELLELVEEIFALIEPNRGEYFNM